jgi:DNA-binding MltR family transcriptional regulator
MKKKTKRIEELDSRMQDFFSIVNDGNDLACVLLSVNYLDEILRTILNARLKESKVTENILNPSSGFLGTFSARIDMVYCLGIFDKKIYNDLRVITQIRNIFAHSFDSISFDSPEVVKLLNQFQWYDSFTGPEVKFEDYPPGSLKYSENRYKYANTVGILGPKLILSCFKEQGIL